VWLVASSFSFLSLLMLKLSIQGQTDTCSGWCCTSPVDTSCGQNHGTVTATDVLAPLMRGLVVSTVITGSLLLFLVVVVVAVMVMVMPPLYRSITTDASRD
jgi:hypothetical protein